MKRSILSVLAAVVLLGGCSSTAGKTGWFTLQIEPATVVVNPAAAAGATLNLKRLDGFAGAVDVAFSGLPPGVTADPVTVAAGEDAVRILLQSDGSGAAASAVITATGTSGATAASATFRLTLESLSIALDQGGYTLAPGESLSIPVHVKALDSVRGSIGIAVSGLPAGVTAGALEILEGSKTGLLELAAGSLAPAVADVPATLTASAGSTTASETLFVTVQPGEPDAVRIQVQPAAVSLPAGAEALVTVGLQRTGASRARTLQIAVRNLPAGVTAEPLAIEPTDASGGLLLHAAADAPPARAMAATVEVVPLCTGTCSALASAPLSIGVVAPFDFAFASDTVLIAQGGTATAPFSVSVRGQAGLITVHLSGLPDGVDAPDAVVAAGANGGAITFAASATALPGSTQLDVSASSGRSTVTQTLKLAIFVPTAGSPSIQSFVPAAAAIFVGERTQLTAIFDGDSAAIDGIGPVQSGVAVDTPLLSRATTFTLRVRRGGEQVEGRTMVQASYRSRIRPLANAPVAQTNHLAAALPGGRAMVMGGNTSELLLLPDSTLSQVFDPETEKFTRGPELRLSAEARLFTSIAPLPGGGFVLAGAGVNDGVGPSRSVATQVFDPDAQAFTRVGDAVTRTTTDRTATPLADGGLLLTGGSRLFPTDGADRYDAATGRWRAVGPMQHVRELHTATLLRDGRVLIAGGITCCQAPDTSPEFFASTAEIYDPLTSTFTETGSMARARASHAAVLLPDGRVLVSGGIGTPSPVSTELYDPATGEFSPAGDLSAPRDSHSAVLLSDGRVLVIGGESPSGAVASSTEIFDPATDRWSSGPTLAPAFFAATVTMLGNGKVLVFGGQDAGGSPQSAAALFE